MIVEACLVAYVVDEDDERYEDDDVIENHIDRVNHIIRNVVRDVTGLKILDLKYIGTSVFVVDFEADSEEQVMDFFNSDIKLDTWLEGDVSLHNGYSIDLECSDCIAKNV